MMESSLGLSELGGRSFIGTTYCGPQEEHLMVVADATLGRGTTGDAVMCGRESGVHSPRQGETSKYAKTFLVPSPMLQSPRPQSRRRRSRLVPHHKSGP